MYYSLLALMGIALNIWLYVDDIRNHDSILNKVDRGETNGKSEEADSETSSKIKD